MPLLDWLNKAHAIRAAAHVPYRLLDAQSVHGDPAADNWLIQGDNLEALKALLPFYAGHVKCIYIDPPYNTRSAFEHYDDNLEHSQWLTMMYPRLELLRELLAEDGSIWVSIDDNEAHYLKVVMDEVFGRGNFVGAVVWQHSIQGKNDAKLLSLHHNYLLSFRKSDRFVRRLLPRTDDHNVNYRNPDNDPRGPWRSGDVRSPNYRENLRFAVVTPSGRKIAPPPNGWRWSEDTFYAKVATGEISFVDDGTRVLRKIYLADQEGRIPESIWFGKEAGTTRDANNHLTALIQSDSPFDTPKPEQLVERILRVASVKGDLVLDSFLGSGTTAAVAHKMGRRYIGIEMGEHAVTHCLPRLEKVIAGEQGGISAAVGWQGGGGFRFFTLGQPVFLPDGGINPEIRFDTLAAWVWYQETRTPWVSEAARARPGTPLLGIHEGTAYALLYNGILGDRRPAGGNVLTSAVLSALKALLPEHGGPWMVFGESCRLSAPRLRAEKLRFRQIPYEIKAR